MVKIILLIRHQYSVVFEYVDVSEVIFSGICCLFGEVLYLGKGVFFWGIAAKFFLQVLDLGKRLGSRKGDIFLRYYNQYFYRCCTAEGVKVKERGNILRNCSQIFTDAVLGKDFGLRKGGGGMGEVDSFHVKYIVILPAWYLPMLRSFNFLL